MTEKGTKTGLTGAHIKWLAIMFMLIDHVGAVLLEPMLLGTEITAVGREILYWVYLVLRCFGRFSFPAFCFLLVEGFYHTRSRGRYLRNMVIFMLVSEVPFDLAISGRAWNAENQNVFFTLAMGFAAIWIAEYLNEKGAAHGDRSIWYRLAGAGAVLLIAIGAQLMHTDYGAVGVAVIYVLYAMHANAFMSTVFAWILLSITNWLEIFCFPFIWAVKRYNGERGRQPKYFFYIFYPAHLLFLAVVRIVFIKI